MKRSSFALLSSLLIAGPLSAQTADQTDFFERRVRPVLVKNCQGCHNAKVKTSGLDLSTGEGFAAGGPSGALVVPGDPDKSLLLRVTSYDDRLKMPPMGKMKDEDRAVLVEWVKAGGVWPGAPKEGAVVPLKGNRTITDADRKFWAFRPVVDPALPAVKNESWVQSPVDRFILAKLEEKKLSPAQPANKLALLRRVTFDLTGLPPTEKEIQEFVADKSPDAYRKVVERLLASPRYGEKWGRNWLDVARYADSTGNDEDHRYPHAWRYRDYVIEAFNKDMPYDQFVREQIAGDLLPPDAGQSINRRGIIATGFLALGPKAIAQQDKKKMLYDVYDEQIEVTSRAFLGLTVQCARCHDHKFDPILTKDYYSMAGIFANTRSFSDPNTHVSQLLFTPVAPPDEYRRYQEKRDAMQYKKEQLDSYIADQTDLYVQSLMPKLADYMLAARAVMRDHADAAEQARAHDLKPEVLAGWVKYLTSTDKGRIHLDAWEQASNDKAPEVARQYQEAFAKRREEWAKQLDEWRTALKTAMAKKPSFPEDKDRFFFEVYFHGPFTPPKKEPEKLFSVEAQQRIAELREQVKIATAAVPPEPDMACAVTEGDPVQQKVFLRGDYNNPGPDAPKAFPVILASFQQPKIEKGSGRLELAKWLTQPDHPLTARVMVNRIWLGHFGEGIVRTPDNFGRMGERPTHPELLDWMAKRFVESGWSVKQMHRLIVLSSAYQMGAEATAEAAQADPENRLFSRFPRRRLNVEEIRDGLLAIDGSLDVTMGGTLQKGTGTDGENDNGRLSIRPETVMRRMVYLPLRRANLPTMLNLYDFGDAATSLGKRPLTTVAPQALFMMNSKFVEDRARNLAQSVMNDSALDSSGRIRELYLRVLNRQPEPAEVDAGLTYLQRFAQKFAPSRTEADAWMSYSRILMASNEFIYVE